MSRARFIALMLLGTALATPGLLLESSPAHAEGLFSLNFGSSGDETGQSAGPGGKHADTPVLVSPSKEKFIYLDDGSSDPLPDSSGQFPLFSESDTAAVSRGSSARKRGLMVRAPQIGGSGISPDAFGMGAGQHSGFQIGYALSEPKSPSKDLGGFGVWISSSAARQASSLGSRWQSLDSSLDPVFNRQSYNVGVKVGYNGFMLGAGLSREENTYEFGYQGVDFGLGYYGRSWFTNVQVAGYRNDGNPFYYNFMGDSLRAVEVGAGYMFWPGFTFTGRFKYFDYSHPIFPSRGNDEQHIFSLDTRLNF